MSELPESGPKELLLWLLRLRRRVGVSGASMFPLLQPGDEVLLDPRAYLRQKPQVGDIVVARRPDRGDVTIIKRVTAVTASGDLILQGDNYEASTDSRDFGAVPLDFVTGQVTSKFA